MFSVQAVKSISVFLLKNGTYEPLYALSDQRFNVHYYFIRTNSYKKITRKSLPNEVFWQPRPQRPDSQLPGRPLPLAACSPTPAVASPAPQWLRRDLLQEPRALYWLHFVSPWPPYSSPWLHGAAPRWRRSTRFDQSPQVRVHPGSSWTGISFQVSNQGHEGCLLWQED